MRWFTVAFCVLISGLPEGRLSAQIVPTDSQGTCIDTFPGSCRQPAASQNATLPPASSQGSSSTNLQSSDRTRDNDQLYVDSAGTTQNRQAESRGQSFPPDPVTDLQRLARSSTGEMLPIFGRDFFRAAPSTFAPGDQVAVTPDYVIGFGDEILLRLWGPETFNSQLSVDRSGSIYIPKVGAIHVAGLRFDELQKQISNELSRTYRNFNLSVNLGRLRSIQIYVVGEARRPGAYTVSSLSTVLNALFASGGPNVQGSLRHIQIRRSGQTLPEFDLYDLVLRGDKTQDIRLETGDTLFIPAVGAQVALGGSVRHPAIYELKHESTFEDVLALAGGFSATASTAQIRLERIEDKHVRQAMTVALDDTGRHMSLRDGDVLYVDHISAGYQQSVTIRGNLANPGRFPWHEGMRLSEIIPDRMSLLTVDYWRERNRLGVPVPLFEPLNQNRFQNFRYNPGIDPRSGQTIHNQASSLVQSDDDGQSIQTGQSTQANTVDQTPQAGFLVGGATSASQVAALNSIQNGGGTNGYGNANGDGIDQQNTGVQESAPSTLPVPTSELISQARNKIGIPAPEIDWSYAAIERLDPNTLKSSIVPFNLEKLVQDHDPSQNLELRPGDVVTILSDADIQVPQDRQTKYVRLEGEFASSGVYSVGPNETLEQLVQRAGGLTSKAYLYGSNFSRESARAFQQQRLDEYIATLSTDMERAAAVRTASSSSGIADPTALSEQRSLIAQLRRLRATGRVVLEFGPASTGVESIPNLPLENGDVFRIPSRPNTVSVIGAVYGQNVFLFNDSRKLEDYVALAGRPNRIADSKHAFIIRADGSIFSRERAKGFISNNFETARINPGDSIVIPEKLIKPTALKNLIDFSQILTSFGLAAAAINVIR